MRLVEGEQSTVAILVTDVEGSTQLRERFGDRVADEILGLHEEMGMAWLADASESMLADVS